MNETLNIKKKHKCELCEYNTNKPSHLKRHLSFKHNINVKWFYCTQNDCEYKCKQKSYLKQHLSFKHDIDVTWFYCTQKGCKSKFKTNSDLKQHLSNRHNIDVTWFYCTQNDCDYKCKNNGDLQRHIKICTGQQTRFSGGEFQVNKALNALGFIEDEDYLFNQSFSDLTNYCGKNLRPDFRLINNKIIIEYDGIQHYIPKNFGGISQERAEDNFKQIQINDKLKDNFCKDHGYKMIRISYKEFPNILSILSSELFDIVDWTG